MDLLLDVSISLNLKSFDILYLFSIFSFLFGSICPSALMSIIFPRLGNFLL